MILKEDPETGKVEEKGCSLKLKDEYRLYPEHDTNGDVIQNNRASSDPFPPGVSIIWENDAPNENGLTFSFRRNRAEEYNFHPLYTIKEINEPIITGAMGNEHVGYAFGESAAALSPGGWANQQVLGIQRVDDCMMGIYGVYNKMEKMVIPKCLRDYTGDIKGWINYTGIPDSRRKKTFFACNESDEKIAKFCNQKFENKDTAAAIYQILIAIKNGEYINLWEALINNGIPREKASAFMEEVSTKSKKTLYSNMNLHKYYLYWHALNKMNLPEDKVYLFRCHLLNFVLNYPGLRKLDPSKPPMVMSGGKVYYPPNRRFWWIAMLIKKAINDSKPYLTNPKIGWFRKLIKEMEKKDTTLLQEEENRHPAVETIASIIGEKKESQGWNRQMRVFSRILLAGKRWNPPEVKITWEYFKKAFCAKKPEDFWQYVETVRTGSPSTIRNLIIGAGILDDDIEFTQQRAFSHHLLEARKSRICFEVEMPKIPERWNTITLKHNRNDADDDKDSLPYSEIFWFQLRRVWGSGKNRFNKIKNLICDNFSQLSHNEASELAEMLQDELSEDVFIGRSLSKDDLGREGKIHIEDIDENEEIGGEEWQDSEFQE